jgi:hypothetical protein
VRARAAFATTTLVIRFEKIGICFTGRVERFTSAVA